ncbi:hypothetical protein [Burkholderia ambifaria]|uniref:hypothetical protein n=1 Tax=Burkholderia ambifaria TaxID=152480 RepID=UPI00158B1088|nr:hypothetical protein [Burkholderia ambifaria]MBY4767968.1 hypothetical protein [Burkholderia ambifaria]
MDCVSALANCIRLAARKPGARSRGWDSAKQCGANKTWGTIALKDQMSYQNSGDSDGRQDPRIVSLKQAPKASRPA